MGGRKADIRERVLAAAKAEVSQHGVAGARVDRIAAQAGTSKERLYAYFRDKQQLMEEVFLQRLHDMASAVPLDEADLPDYVARLFDYFIAHPEDLRISRWYALEGGHLNLVPNEARRQGLSERLERVRRAQAEGLVDAVWTPADLLNLLFQIAISWASAPTELHELALAEGGPVADLATHRRAAYEAARRIVTPQA